QLANDVPKIRNRALVRLQYVNPLDRIPQPAFFFEVQPVTLFVALNEYSEEAEEKLQVLFGLRQREGVDGEIPRFLTHIEIEPSNIVVSDWKLPPISKMKVSGLYFCAFCSRKLQKYDLPLPVIPRISVWATSP